MTTPYISLYFVFIDLIVYFYLYFDTIVYTLFRLEFTFLSLHIFVYLGVAEAMELLNWEVFEDIFRTCE